MVRKLKGGLTNLRGTKVGNLHVEKRVYSPAGKRPRWRCICKAKDCGKSCTVSHNRLISKTNPKTHCGCQRGGLPKKFKKEYHAWWDAKSRCHNAKHPSYKGYGAKGIKMCTAWRDSFEAFIGDMGKVPKGKSLDRIDPFGNYQLSNCRWATDKEQARNKKGTKFVKHPKTKKDVTVGDLAEELGLTYQQLRNKLIDEGKW